MIEPVFFGSKEDFNRFFSGYGRNLVQRITKKYKNEVGHCEHCGAADQQLDAAHVYGKERKKILDSILTEFEAAAGVQVNLNDFEKEFINAHEPISETIKILCKPCHRKYDGNHTRTKVSRPSGKSKVSSLRINRVKVINTIENYLRCRIDRGNFNLSTINSTGDYSVEPNQNCPEREWHLSLINTHDKVINYFVIPKHGEVYSELYYRKDKDRYRLVFETRDDNFKEKYCGVKFARYLVSSFSYSEITLY